MSTKTRISGLENATALDGSELIPIDQAGVTVKTTANDIANSSYKVWTAALIQSTSTLTSGLLIIGNKYFISTVAGSDDFSNIGFVDTSSLFTATGTTPTNWTNNTNVIDATASAPRYLSQDVNAQSNPWIDTIGITGFEWLSVGLYAIKSDGAFTNLVKTFLLSPGNNIFMGYADTSTILISSGGDDNVIGVNFVGGIFFTNFEIRVYGGLID